MSDKEQEDADMAQVHKAAEQLGEHFDTVQIFVTRYEPLKDGGTTNVHYGTGNWFTRFGQVRHWTAKQDELARQEARGQN